MIKDIADVKNKISKNNINTASKFITITNKDFKSKCKILEGNFFLDSFNYFPISEDDYTFVDFFLWGDKEKYNNFYNENFYNNYVKQKNNFKSISEVFILGSSATGNYYRDMFTFFPRLIFLPKQKINLVVHRNSTNKFRNFIIEALKSLNIELNKFVYLDDNFYRFQNSKIPQFLSKKDSITILNNLLFNKTSKDKNDKKIYISRQGANSRNLINEKDIIDILKKKGFEIVNPKTMMIKKQINLFSSAKVIISATCSSLTNIVFCKKNTQILEIKPKYLHKYEEPLKNRYSDICKFLNLKYDSIEADPVNIDRNSSLERYIPRKILGESNYYKDLLVMKSLFSDIVKNY